MAAKKKEIAFQDWGSIESVEAWSTGNFLLDWQSGVGGLPKGRVVEAFGPESSGKSTLFLQTAAYVWETHGIPSHWGDFEDTFDSRYARSLGLSPEGLHLSQATESLEDYLEELDEILSSGTRYALTVVDSVAAARTREDLTAAVDSRTGGMNRARIWTQNLSRIGHALSESEITLCLVNQLRDNIITDFMPPGMKMMQPKTKTPGGRGIKFYASLRIEFDPTASVKVERMNPLTLEPEMVEIGKKVWIKVKKNKCAPPPWRKARVEIRDGMGFDTAWNLLDFCVTHGVIKKGSQGRFTFPGHLFESGEPWTVGPTDGWKGEDVAAQVLRENDVLRESLLTIAAERLADVTHTGEEEITLGLAAPDSGPDLTDDAEDTSATTED